MTKSVQLYGPAQSVQVEETRTTSYGRTLVTFILKDGHKVEVILEHMGSTDGEGMNFAAIFVRSDNAKYSVDRNARQVQVNVHFPTE
jgi:hypothetical protein